MSIAASSERMSPNMLSARITSKWRGAATSFIAAESTSWCSSSTFGNSSACTRVTTSRHSRPVSSTFILSMLVTRVRAARNAVRAIRSISGGRVLAQVGRVVVRARLRAEVDAAGELAHDEQVGALDQLALERAGVVERRQRAHRAQVRVQAERLAQAEQALLGPRRGRVGRVPLRAADRGEQHGVGRPAGGDGRVGQRRCRGRRSRRRRTVLLVGERADGVEDARRGGEDLRADAVARAA